MELEFDSGLFLYISVIVYITTGISSAYTKWFHICLPYKDRPEFYFPNRRRWTFTFASTLLLAGCVLCPSNFDNWISARCFCILITQTFIICGIKKHFDRFQKNPIWFQLTNVPIVVEFILCFIGWLNLGILTKYKTIVLLVAGILGAAYTCGAIISLVWLKRKINYYYENKFSNEEEFPKNHATELIPMLAPLIPIFWMSFLSTSPILTGISYLIIAIMQIIFVVYVLDCHIVVKSKVDVTVEESEDDIDNQGVNEDEEISTSDIQDAIGLLDNFMSDKKPYLNPHLTIIELSYESKLNIPSLRQACKVKYGSFIKMVNTYRLEHAKVVHKEHPEYSKQAIAEESGFGSYRSLLRAEKQQAE